MLFIAVTTLIYPYFSKVRDKPCYFLNEITLFPDGVVEIHGEQCQMHLNSRIGVLGCWLCLAEKGDARANSKTLFIFKSNVSEYHYSQLCRVIKRNTLEHSKNDH